MFQTRGKFGGWYDDTQLNRTLKIEEIISKALGDSLAITKSTKVIKPGLCSYFFSS